MAASSSQLCALKDAAVLAQSSSKKSKHILQLWSATEAVATPANSALARCRPAL
jgi:hypothetical protein